MKKTLFQAFLYGDTNTSISVEKIRKFSQRINAERVRR